ncbi:MAG: PAS domain S-box protein [Candidatus Methylomirabilales bacterium]
MKDEAKTREQLERELAETRQLIAERGGSEHESAQAEHSPEKQRDRVQKYLDVAGIMIVVIDADQRVTLINKKGCEILEWKQEEILGKNWFETCISERMRDRVRGVFTKLMAGEIEPFEYVENPVMTSSGEERIIAWHNTVLKDDAGSIIATLSSGEDITERKRGERRINTQFAVTHVFAESATLRDATSPLLRALCEGIGWELGELWRVDATSNVLRWDGSWHAPSLETGELDAISRETTFSPGSGLPGLVWASGSPAWISDVMEDACFNRMSLAAQMGLHGALAFPIRGERDVTGVIVFFTREVREPDHDLLKDMADIGSRIGLFTERKRAAEALRKSEATGRALLESAAEGIVIVNPGGRIVLVNAKTEELFGYHRDELLGQSLEVLLPERFQDAHAGHRVAYFADPRVRPMGTGFDLAARRKDGTEFPVEISLSFVKTEDGIIAMGFITDITERKRAEEALAREVQEVARLGEEAQVREAFIRDVVESIRDGIIVVDREGRITAWNRAMEELYGMTATEVRGLPILKAFPQLKVQGFAKVIERILEEKEEVALGGFEHETRFRGRVTMDLKGSPLRTLTGEVIGAVFALEDVTERIELERIARQSEKMAAVGTLAAGIAHEINNPIGIITSRVELMLMEARERSLKREVIKDLRVLEKHAGRVAKITQGLLSFSRQAPWKLTSVDVNQVVEDALLLVEKQLAKEGIALKKDLAADLPKIQGSTNHLEQVIVNLLTNAREAMPRGGALRVSTAVHRLPSTDDRMEEDRAGHRTSVIEDDMVEFRIGDTGPGIPPEILPRIFDPFFTTKEQGSGLGLSITYGIVREHGGTINVDSRPGEGSTFIIQLPIPGGSKTGGVTHGERAHPRHR